MFQLSKTLPKKRTLISGAASGFGESYSVQLGGDGWTVGLCDVNAAALEEAADKVEAAGGKPYVYCFDVRDRDAYGQAVEDFVGKQGGIDLLINNAGIGSGGTVGDMSLEDWDRTLDINLKGVIHGLHFAVPSMKAQRAGYIINTASVAAFTAAPGMAAYNASKAAVLAISETVRSELADFGIGVSCLMPHFVRTNLHKTLIGTPEAIAGANRLVTNAKHVPDDVTRYALEQAARGEFYIIYPKEFERIWMFKRFFPRRYFAEALKFARQLAARPPR